jgi:GTPase SAR1 family protein
MGNTNSVPSTSERRLPDIKFRVLIIGRANSGKTSILQRICDTTESPVVRRGDEEVRGLTFVTLPVEFHPPRFNLSRPWRSVTVRLRLECS